MPPAFERTSTITEKGQTTVPKPVRDALGVSYGGRIVFRVDDHGVSVHRAEQDADDPVLRSFLEFLAGDMSRRPQALQALTPALAGRIGKLVKGVHVDPSDAVEGKVDF
jgi:antitoxin PrlF